MQGLTWALLLRLQSTMRTALGFRVLEQLQKYALVLFLLIKWLFHANFLGTELKYSIYLIRNISSKSIAAYIDEVTRIRAIMIHTNIPITVAKYRNAPVIVIQTTNLQLVS